MNIADEYADAIDHAVKSVAESEADMSSQLLLASMILSQSLADAGVFKHNSAKLMDGTYDALRSLMEHTWDENPELHSADPQIAAKNYSVLLRPIVKQCGLAIVERAAQIKASRKPLPAIVAEG